MNTPYEEVDAHGDRKRGERKEELTRTRRTSAVVRNMEFPYKKRQRIPASCSVCRKRKSKCDRVKPICGSCKKKSIAHLCFFESEKADMPPAGGSIALDGGIAKPVRPNGGEIPNRGGFGYQGTADPFPYARGGLQDNRELSMTRGSMFDGPENVPGVTDPMYQQMQRPPLDQSPAPLSQFQPPPHNLSNQLHALPTLQKHTPEHFQAQLPNQADQLHQHPPQHPHNQVPMDNHGLPYQPSEQAFNSETYVPNFPGNQYHSPIGDDNSQLAKYLKLNSGDKSFISDLVTVTIGPNSTLRINPHDRIDLSHNASDSFLTEGPNWQQQGPLSYIGVTKSDPFLKFIRSYAISLFKSGSMTPFIKSKSMKRRKKTHHLRSPLNQKQSTDDQTNPDNKSGSSLDLNPKNDASKSEIMNDLGEKEKDEHVDYNNNQLNNNDNVRGERTGGKEMGNEENDEADEDDEEDVNVDDDDVEEDALIVTKIKINSEEANTDDGKRKLDIPQILPGQLYVQHGKNKNNEVYKVIEKAVLDVLPSRKNSFILFCQFFKYVYPFVPVVEEHSLLVDFNRLLSERFPMFTKGHYMHLEINNVNDLNVLGMFLLVIRLGYMCLLHNEELNNGINEDERSMIKEMKLFSSEEYLRVVNLCIPEDRSSQKSTFKTVQCLTLLYYYRLVTPEDCHGLSGNDSQVLFGNIITQAFSIGLSRDPTTYISNETISKNPPLIRTWRSLWNFLVTTDAYVAVHAGTALNIRSLDICDVADPEHKNTKLEDTYANTRTICQYYRNICNLLSNIQTKPRIVEILMETNKLEKLFYNFFGKDFFKDYICTPGNKAANSKGQNEGVIGSIEHEESYLKVIKFNTFIQLRTTLSCMYYRIAIFYENEYTESKTSSMGAGIELFKIYIKSVVQLNYIMSYVLDNSVDAFGRHYDYVLTAHNERCMIKTHGFLSSFFIRLIHHKKVLTTKKLNDEGDSSSLNSKLEAIDKLFKMVLIEAELFVGNFRKMSRNYINSYRIFVMTYFVLKQCMDDPDIFFELTLRDDKFFHEGTNMLEFFTVGELNHLCKLCEEFRYAKEEQGKKRNDNSVSPESVKNLNPMNLSSQPKFFDSDLSESQPGSNRNPSSTTQSSPIGVEPSTHGLSSSIPGFDNPAVQNEDLLKLFQIYNDSDQGFL